MEKIVCSRKSTWRRRCFCASSFAVEIMFSEFHRKMEYVFAANRSPGLDAVSRRSNCGTPASSFVNEAYEKTLTLKNNRVFIGWKTKYNLREGFFEKSFRIPAFFLDKLFRYFYRISVGAEWMFLLDFGKYRFMTFERLLKFNYIYLTPSRQATYTRAA